MNRAEAGRLGMLKSKANELMHNKHLALRDKYNKNPKLCKLCSKPLSYEDNVRRNDFCDRACYGKYKSRMYGLMPRKERSCACGAPSVIGRCRKCYCGTTRVEKLENARTDRTRRQILIRLHGHKCWSCALTEWKGLPIPIELEHADGNSDNNSKENLSLVCPNCHALTPTYKGKNKGNSKRQVLRRGRYSSGKTF